MGFNIRDFVTGAAKLIRSTVIQVTTDEQEHVPHHVSEVAPSENRVFGTGSTTGAGSTAVTGMGAAGASLKNYVSAVQVANKGATAVLVTLQDGSGGAAIGYVYVGAGETVPVVYPSPLPTTANTGLFFQADGSTTTLYVSAQGYVAA